MCSHDQGSASATTAVRQGPAPLDGLDTHDHSATDVRQHPTQPDDHIGAEHRAMAAKTVVAMLIVAAAHALSAGTALAWYVPIRRWP